jgi:3-phenylpropionate/trans-cinnamate dioxygenase ferredoxin component
LVLLGAFFRHLLEAAGRQRMDASSRQNKGEMMTSNVKTRVEACDADEIEEEDVIRFDHGGRTFAIYRLEGDEYFASDGLCTHEQVHLADGLVMDNIIECPKHNGRFDIRTGAAKGAPVCVNLKTYPVKVENGKVMIGLDG